MEKKNILTEESSLCEYELAIMQEENKELQEIIDWKKQKQELSKEAHRHLRKAIAVYFQ